MDELKKKWKLPSYKPVKSVKLEARVFHLHDAAFRRRYLVEAREKESPEAKYMVGDIVWVKLKDKPWWPAMVSVHPQRDIYMKYSSGSCTRVWKFLFYFCNH